MGRHELEQPPFSLKHYGEGALFIIAVLTVLIAGTNILPEPAPRFTAEQAARIPSYDITSRFLAGMARTKIETTDREPLILRVAKRVCGAPSDQAAMTDAAVAAVALLLNTTSTQAFEFVVYSRKHCPDLG